MTILITGGFGFIGSNTAARLSALQHDVVVVDNLSRPGAELNRQWLQQTSKVESRILDVRDRGAIERLFTERRFDVVIHLAGQVAVTTSVLDPRHDFEVNALGTFNVLEAVRSFSPETIVINASTNKVYGKLGGVPVREGATRYEFENLPYGVAETHQLDFVSPYGCSKGAADSYVNDYARIFGLRTVNFRQSCIYGERQFGMEDQGWVAWFMIAHLTGLEVTVYGSGKQIRDLLMVEDLVDAYLAAIARIDQVAGQSFNIGGGPSNTLSLLELLTTLETLSGRAVPARFAEWRPGDQPVFVSDIRHAEAALGWRPRIGTAEGLRRLWGWVSSNQDVMQVAGAKSS